jgi:hypothetical protein
MDSLYLQLFLIRNRYELTLAHQFHTHTHTHTHTRTAVTGSEKLRASDVSCVGHPFFWGLSLINKYVPLDGDSRFYVIGHKFPALHINILVRISVSISACHAEERGSIPRRGEDHSFGLYFILFQRVNKTLFISPGSDIHNVV